MQEATHSEQIDFREQGEPEPQKDDVKSRRKNNGRHPKVFVARPPTNRVLNSPDKDQLIKYMFKDRIKNGWRRETEDFCPI